MAAYPWREASSYRQAGAHGGLWLCHCLMQYNPRVCPECRRAHGGSRTDGNWPFVPWRPITLRDGQLSGACPATQVAGTVTDGMGSGQVGMLPLPMSLSDPEECRVYMALGGICVVTS